MKILFLTPGRNVPSSRFRVAPYLPHLRKRGHECVVAPSHPNQYGSYRLLGWRLSQRLRRTLREWQVGWARRRRFDLIFLVRELFNDDSFDVEQRFRGVCSTMILDVDDAIWLNHAGKDERLAEICNGVIAGNRLLAERLARFNSHVTVVPTCVDIDRYVPRSPSVAPRPVIGWTGTSSNIPFLKEIRDPLRELAREREYELRVIADDPAPLAAIDFSGINVRFVKWRAATELEDLRQFDIGLMPLPDTEWTRYKCGLKIIQYMAIGIPTVASPVGANSEIVSPEESGYLPTTPEEWRTILRHLIDRPELRFQVGQAGRRRVELDYSIQTNLAKFERTLSEAVSRTRG